MTRYVALLRGINVGGKNIIKMDALRAALTASGVGDVRTLLASGNVAFDAEEADSHALTERVETMLLTAFGREVRVVLRTSAQVQALIASAPFRDVLVTPETRLFVSFLTEPPDAELATLYPSPDRDFEILRVTPTEVCSVLSVASTRSVDVMKTLERLFGPGITTRNWNTVQKLATL